MFRHAAPSRAEHDRAHFDRWAEGYDQSVLQALLFAPAQRATLAAAEAAAARSPEDVLDIGCGTGRLLEQAAARWPSARLVGIDASPNMVRQAERKHPGDRRLRFQTGDAASLPFEGASFDAAFTTVSFHHWADQLMGVREVARVLRPGGIFVLADFKPLLLLRLFPPVANRFHSRPSRRRLFDAAGLKVLAQHAPVRLLGQILVTVGQKAVLADTGQVRTRPADIKARE